MTTKIRIYEEVFVDLKRTPKSLVDKAANTVRQEHAGISVRYVDDSSDIQISKIVFAKPGASQDYEKRTRKAILSVRDAKQTFHRELKRLQELTDILKDVYGLEPIEGGD